MATRTATAVPVKNVVSQRSVRSSAVNNAQVSKSKQYIKSSPSQLSASSHASQLNEQKPMFNNMTRSSVSRPYGEKRSGLQDIDYGSYYQVHYGNRTTFGNPQLPSPIDPQVIHQQIHLQQQQAQQQLQQNNISPQQFQQQQISPQQMQQQINQHQMPPQQQPIPVAQQACQHVVNPVVSQQAIPQQQVVTQQVIPQQQVIPPQQIPQQIPQQQIAQQIPPQQSQMEIPQTADHHGCYHEAPVEQMQQQQVMHQQQVPMQAQMNNQQMVQQMQPQQHMSQQQAEAMQQPMYHETCPNCAATFACTIVPQMVQG
jgi:hypothetical protein